MDRRTLKNLDFLFIFVTCLLLIASLLILSTASFNVLESDPLHYVKSQAIWIMIGIGIATLIAVIDYEKWRTYRWWIYGFNITLLLAVIFLGDERNGAVRWIATPFGFNIQPSEFAKIFIILTLADFLAVRQGKLNNYKDFVMPFLIVLLPMLLIFKQPDLGTTLVFLAIFIGMMFVAGANPKKFGGLLLGGAVIVGVALWLHFATNLPGWLYWAQGLPLPMEDYQLKRLTVFRNPAADISGDGYHIIQSIWAIGSGGLWGKGFRMGTQGQLNFLPEHHTDFIFPSLEKNSALLGRSPYSFSF